MTRTVAPAEPATDRRRHRGRRWVTVSALVLVKAGLVALLLLVVLPPEVRAAFLGGHGLILLAVLVLGAGGLLAGHRRLFRN